VAKPKLVLPDWGFGVSASYGAWNRMQWCGRGMLRQALRDIEDAYLWSDIRRAWNPGDPLWAEIFDGDPLPEGTFEEVENMMTVLRSELYDSDNR
jgi:hypothetical protein